MKSISKENYEKFITLRTELDELILRKVNELSMIISNRLPEGVCYDHDFNYGDDDKLVVQFESSHCHDTDYDTFYLPLEFLFDETYPERYKLIYEEEQKIKREEEEKRKKEKELKQREGCERFERKEYERLKAKYEKKEIKCPVRKEKGIFYCSQDCVDRDTCPESAK